MLLLYARVSTKKQQKHGNLKRQVEILKHYAKRTGNNNNYRLYAEAFTGTTDNRPKFNLLKKTMRNGDTVVLARLDRFSRNFRQAVDDIDDMEHAGVDVIALQPWEADLNKMSENEFYAMLNFGDMEHKAIMNRTRLGKIFAVKTKGKEAYGGHPKRSKHARHYNLVAQYAKKHPAQQTADAFGCSKRTVFRIKNWYRKEVAK